MAEKLCVFCVNLRFNASYGGEYADPSNFECRKRHRFNREPESYDWHDEGDVHGIDDMRRIITTAQNCPDYEQVSTDS